ncbi:NAD(P)H-dependent glycerol-3-phosphate dehydrogenase [Candidatus Erwinia haradaeae]|uniref:Glycerol-3-phosphate dehydrogenase [NAD(P)+] n=1 Tax=Candidatus Erwinia haradaeae TaxID=1922217 RepID=A0A803FSW2_9GAMM|nr:NAD(P)H-dependent glycerol-3-phosphate dehydrogenase [Candidatus Erwinia haradaeae]VFP87203.1 Glycerol-3-phosphate dehydrogenase [NAD(P)+] [Candidatus Erwinia haradaeae]
MHNSNAVMSIIGSGCYGTALAITLARKGNTVLLWGRNRSHQDQLQLNRSHHNILPNTPFPSTLIIENDLKKTIEGSRNLLLVVPSHAFGEVLCYIKPHLRSDSRLAWATKGLEKKTGRLLQEVAHEILGDHIPLAVISGPTFAKEMAEGMPTAITLAATDSVFATELQQILHCGANLRVYKNTDLIGVQLGGAIKNIIAIGAGISDGIGFGANTRTALITRGLAEMGRMGTALNANPSTFTGMAGLGDLVLTCTDNQSRNRRFGIMIGTGKSVQNAIQSIGQLIEGWYTTKEVKKLALRYNVEMPITEQIYQILYCGKNVKEAAYCLLQRQKKNEYHNKSDKDDSIYNS